MVRKVRSRDISVSSPVNLQHEVHIDHNFAWHVTNPANSLKMDKRIGESSVGIMYKATFMDTQNHFAVQIVEGDWEKNEMEHLQREVSLWQRLRNSNIISYYGSCAAHSNLWILMDYCKLGSLQDVMQVCARTLFEAEIAYVCASILRALKYLHTGTHPIVHKDIKSASIQLLENGEIKLGNFGISQNRFDVHGACIAGTPHFMAPEVASAKRHPSYETKSDIWSLGVTAIELAEGSPKNWDINRTKLKRRNTPRLHAANQWSHEFNDFIRRCLIRDVNIRPTAEALLSHPFIESAKENCLKKLCQQALKANKKKDTQNSKKPSKIYCGH